MKHLVIMLMLTFAGFATKAQSAKELIGKWKLVKETKNGNVTAPKDTYQVFEEGGIFQGIKGDKSRKGRWTLSSDNSILTIKISIISIKFKVEYFDAEKRVISSEETGRLEYVKVKE